MGALQVEPELRIGTEPGPKRRAVSPVTARLPAMIRLTRLGGTSICRANSAGVIPSSSNSSLRTSPG